MPSGNRIVATNTRETTCEGREVLVRERLVELRSCQRTCAPMAYKVMGGQVMRNAFGGLGKIVERLGEDDGGPSWTKCWEGYGCLAKNPCRLGRLNNGTVGNSAVVKFVATIDKAKAHVQGGRFLRESGLWSLGHVIALLRPRHTRSCGGKLYGVPWGLSKAVELLGYCAKAQNLQQEFNTWYLGCAKTSGT